MAYAGGTPRRLDVRAEFGRFLALLGATGVAIAQPVLDAFGKSPETFILRQADTADLVTFALAVALVPALSLWAVGALVGWVLPRARVAVDGASIGLLAGLVLAQLVPSWPWVLTVAASSCVGLLCWVLVVQLSPVRLWLQLLAALPVVAVMLFVTTSEASDAVSGGDLEPVAAGVGARGAPIVLIVLDELPTASLLGADGEIDRARFPNIAELASEATWYRNATTTSGWTATAVPAIFSGLLPENNSQLFTQRPNSIFRLLAATHDLVVSEPATRLCPTDVCAAPPISPAHDADLGRLLGDAVELFVQRLSGGDVADQLAQFAAEEGTDAAAATSPPSRSGSVELPTSSEVQPVAQPPRIDAFIDSLAAGDRPLAAVLHAVLPHHPWHFLPDGRRHEDPADGAWLAKLPSNDWVVNVERQLHLLQAMYADRIVGQILGAVRELGIYDDAVVVLTADHGVAFLPTGFGRRLERETAGDIMWVPLVVKAPGQEAGRVDDANVQNIDVFPTIASLAGVEIPWPIDGVPADSPAISARGDHKRFYRLKSILEQDEEVLSIDGRAGLRTMTASGFPAITAGDDAVRGLYRLAERGDLVGQPLQTSAELTTGALEIDDRERLLRADRPVLTVSGSVADDVSADHVIAAVDRTVVAISPVYELGGRRRFLFLLPASAPVDPRRVELAVVDETILGERIRSAGSLGG